MVFEYFQILNVSDAELEVSPAAGAGALAAGAGARAAQVGSPKQATSRATVGRARSAASVCMVAT